MNKFACTFVVAVLLATTWCSIGCSSSSKHAQEDIESINQAFAEKAYEYFIELSAIPRGSGNMLAISDYLTAFGRERGLLTIQDEALNVFIKKTGSVGRGGEAPIILQGHMDMVCQKNSGIDHDFLRDPIVPWIDGDWIKAHGTTLGADNGGGLAIILAVLDSDNLSHPPIEVVITTDEETTMNGALSFDTSLLSGNRIINLDEEDEGIFVVSCAGGASAGITIPIQTLAMPNGLVTYELNVKGLIGGHSGVDINSGRANANLLIARLINAIANSGIFVASIDGGTARNAITRECTAVLSFPEGSYEAIQAVISAEEATIKSEFPIEIGLMVTWTKTSDAQTAINPDSLQRVLDCILGLPNGMLAMSPDIAGLVQTSSNLGIIETGSNEVMLTCMPRSSVPAELAETIETMKNLAELLGGKLDISDAFPAWPYKANSPLRDALIDFYKGLYGVDPMLGATHGGLECGVFAEKMPHADIISIGPTVFDAHSPDERMSLSSFNRTCGFVIEILKKLPGNPTPKSSGVVTIIPEVYQGKYQRL
ncbi:MAG: aminoacyl-histidine dipeptidase [Holophagaceae bacterium]|nr:aminoacyl-histidine dipeptidase [Holophagaceae bacterium]